MKSVTAAGIVSQAIFILRVNEQQEMKTMPQNLFPWLANELTLSAAICKRGDKTPDVRKIQEWLYLDGFGLVVDGDFGPATDQAVKAFQAKKKMPVSGVVDAATFTALSSPLKAAETGKGGTGQLGDRIVTLANQHLQYHPPRGRRSESWSMGQDVHGGTRR